MINLVSPCINNKRYVSELYEYANNMGDPERNPNYHAPGAKKRSIDEIIDHMTADLQSYDGQYILLGSPQNPQHVWSEYSSQQGHPMTVQHNPVFVQQTYDMQEKKVQEFPPQHRVFYPNTQRVHDGAGEMIGMMDVGGGNYVNVVFNPTSSANQIHSYVPAHHSDPNIGFIHYQQQQQHQQTQASNNLPVHRDYGLFSSTPTETPSQNNHQLIENVVGNWLPNKSGTYSPFGNMTHTPTEVRDDDTKSVCPGQPGIQKKTRIVAEVRPMRPSYSDVLSKSPPPSTPPLQCTKPPLVSGSASKNDGRKLNSKGAKGGKKFKTNLVNLSLW